MIELRGMTWDHARGFDPVQATAQSYMRLQPDVRVSWTRRSLREFAERSVIDLAEDYDLIVLDHPWIGTAVAREALLPLDTYLDTEFLQDQAANSVGPSYKSYLYEGHLWALPVDAAAQVSAYRPDLLDEVPRRWDAVMRLLKDKPGQVGMALMPVDCLPTFVSLCANAGEGPGQQAGYFVSPAVGRQALHIMRDMVNYAHPASLDWNPPQVLDHMSNTDEILYCPLLFGYSNYARLGYRNHIVHFTDIPLGIDQQPSGAILGGAGLAVSHQCREPEAACRYAAYVASPTVQRGEYFLHSGQPGHRSAWVDPQVNAQCSDFFQATLATLDHAYLRPRFNGYVDFQDAACAILHRFLRDAGDAARTLNELNTVYRAGLVKK